MASMEHAGLPGKGSSPARRVIVIGGGASGVLMSVHLLSADTDVQVTLIERNDLLGCGVAYGTSDANHLLNTRVSSMSAFPDDPGHFLRWLRASGEPHASPYGFAERQVYGRYMADLLRPWLGGPRLICRKAECVGLSEGSGGVRAILSDGGEVEGDLAILATGHPLPDPASDPDKGLTQPWAGGNEPEPDPAARVLIIGSGLTMVDQVLSLAASGHSGEIVALSRRGLLPRAHADAPADPIPPEDLPDAASARKVMRWLRGRAAAHAAAGGDWRSVVDGFRPHVQDVWRSLPDAERARFLRHACASWEVHRHRMPPSSARAVAALEAAGRLKLLRGAFLGARRLPDGGVGSRIRLAGGAGEIELAAGRVIDCRGIRRDPELHAGPLLRSLLDAGAARIDPLRLGIAVDGDCRIVGAAGTPSRRLYAIGPASRAALWEITAIPDIREQAERLAAELLEAS